MTIVDAGVELVVVWHGATHREFPQPRIGTVTDPERPRPLLDDVRAYLRRHPHTWRQVRQIATTLKADAYDVRDRLSQLVLRGEILTETHTFSRHARRPEHRHVWKWREEAPARLLRRKAS